jgi:hypothetical protein
MDILIKDKLMELLDSWTLSKCDIFHNYEILDPEIREYMWDIDSNGDYYLWGKNSAHCFTTSGHVHKFSKFHTHEDFQMTLELYNAGQEELIFIEQPLIYEDHGMYKYVQMKRLHGLEGRNMYEDIMKMDNAQSIIQYLLKLVEDFKSLCLLMDSVIIDNRFPWVPQRRTVGNSVYWSDFKWFGKFSTREEFISEFAEQILNHYMIIHSTSPEGSFPEESEQLLKEALWKI